MNRNFLLATMLVASTAFAAKSQEQLIKRSHETRAIMDRIFADVTSILPASLDEKEFQRPERRKAIEASLLRLRNDAVALRQHASQRDKGFSFIASSLERDAKETYRWYRKGAYGEARYTIQNLTENCIGCHSKLPAEVHFPPAQSFFKDTDIAKLSLPEKARLLVATRQFDEALNTYEEMFASSKISPQQLVMMDSTADYLRIAIRVKGDLRRPIRVLKAFAAKPDTPRFAQTLIDAWISALNRNASNAPPPGDDLAIGKALVTKTQASLEYPMDRTGLIDFLVASTYLNRFLSTSEPSTDAAKVAEAYYLLGITESVTSRSFWLSETSYYFESAIRTAPKSSIAKKAYNLLEQENILLFSGSAGIDIPEDIEQNLAELRALMR